MRHAAGAVLAALALVALQWGCDKLVAWAGWPLPGSMLGLLLLWLALGWLGRVPEELAAVSNPLQRHLMLWLIPSVAAIGEQFSGFAPRALALAGVIVAATLLTVVVSACVLTACLRAVRR